ncbi:MAG: hypothetical protein F9K22_06750 [Bacteroidetes bacterium]|nr:MAG: hypothetical protein F9K22_06750 [Bacteroidota bacterium]
MNRPLHTVILVAALAAAGGCSATQPVAPVRGGETVLLSSLGGPVIPLDGLAIPAPYVTLGAVHGVTEDVSVYGNVHVTAALFKNAGLDAGVVTDIVTGEGAVPSVSVNGRGYFFWDVGRGGKEPRFFPAVTLAARSATGERSAFFLGADNLFQLHRFYYIISPFAGFRFPLSASVTAQTEVKWLGANKETRHGIFEGATSVGGHGGLGLFLSVDMEMP